MVKTIDEIFGDEPEIVPKFNESILQNKAIHPNGYFDEDDDSLVLFFDESARHGIYVPMAGGYHVIVHPTTHEVVGIYVEGWVEDYVSQIPVLQSMWSDVTTRETSGKTGTKAQPRVAVQESFWASLFAFLLTFVVLPTGANGSGELALVGVR